MDVPIIGTDEGEALGRLGHGTGVPQWQQGCNPPDWSTVVIC
jgi:hypothetical protein